jgi:hypothetical protein
VILVMTRKRSSRMKKIKGTQTNLAPVVAELRALTKAMCPKMTRKPRGSMRPTLMTPMRYIQALQNPFHPESAGAKIPNFDGTPSFTYASKDLFTVSSDAAGYSGGALYFFSPFTRNYVTTNTAGNFVLNGATQTPWSDSTALLSISNITAQRVVAGGLKITNLLSLAGTNPASGRLVIAPVSSAQLNALVLTVGAPFTEATVRKLPGAMVIPLAALAASEDPVFGLSGPLDPSSFAYLNPTAGPSTNNINANNVCYVYTVTGAPNSVNILEIEMVCHWEILPVFANATLCTAGIQSNAGIIDRAMDFMQTHDLISFGRSALEGGAGMAFDYVTQIAKQQVRRAATPRLDYY